MKQLLKKQDQYATPAKSGAKSIMDLVLTDKKPKITKTTNLYNSSPPGKKLLFQAPEGTEFTLLDFSGNWLRIAFTEGEVKREGWIEIQHTSLSKADILFAPFREGKDLINRNWESGKQQFERAAVKDYTIKNKQYAGTFDEIPKESRDNYYQHSFPPYTDMIKDRVTDKQQMARKLVNDYTKLYALDKIFDPQEMQNDQSLDKKDRKFVDANFPGGQVSVSMGNTPDYSKNDDDSNILSGGGDWIATMEVLYPKETKDLKAQQIILDIPLSKFLYGDSESAGFKNSVEVLAIMIAHEFLHTAQNTMLHFQDIAKLPNLDGDELEKRKTVREILAYHFTLFPNKSYDSAEQDPVFHGTRFVRGQSAAFINMTDLEKVFLVWKALNYFRRLDAIANKADLVVKYKLEELRKDFANAAKGYSEGEYKIEFDPASGLLKRFFAAQDASLNEDQKYMNYLFWKSKNKK